MMIAMRLVVDWAVAHSRHAPIPLVAVASGDAYRQSEGLAKLLEDT